MVDLGPYDPDPQSHAFARGLGVSDDGSVVVGHGLEQDWPDGEWYDMGFRWTEQEGQWVMDSLGTLGGESSRAYAVAADGSVIVGSSENAAGHWEAFRWENYQMTGLGTLGGSSSYPEAASAGGRVIVGYGSNPAGNLEAWRAVIPEPSTLALLCTFLTAGAVWLWRNNRKRQ